MRINIALVLAIALSGCTSVPPAAPVMQCRPTVEKMTPPTEAVAFFAGGSSQPEMARDYLLTKANWFGNDAMWVVLPEDGEIVGRLFDKIPPYRLKTGYVSYEARRLDGPERVSKTAIGPSGYGDLGFQAGGPTFPTTGCWEVTYLLNDGNPLSFVLRVRPAPIPQRP